MSRQSEDRNVQKFAEKMRQKTQAAKTAKLAGKKAPAAPSAEADGNKKD